MDCVFICPSCGAKYPVSREVWRCECGNYLDLDYHPVPDRSKIDLSDRSFWRYSHVLPLNNLKNAISYGEGGTPLVDMEIKGVPFLGKMDFMLPSGSFKDRGASLMISKCKEMGIEEIVEDSSGNSACSVSAYCARGGIKANIYMPAGNSSAKSIQAASYGSEIHLIEGNRIDCANAALEAAKMSYYAAHAWNPFFIHGTKTIIYEIVEQLGWRAPDSIFIPVGSGSQIIGVYLGLVEMMEAGIIDKMTRLIAVQSNKCSPLKDFVEGRETPISARNPSIAEGIAIHRPVRLRQIIDVVQKTGGDFITVDDNEIIAAMKVSARQGVYIEPTSASAVAAVLKDKSTNAAKEVRVVSLTGTGLKSSYKF